MRTLSICNFFFYFIYFGKKNFFTSCKGVSPEPAFDNGTFFKIDEGDFEISYDDLYKGHA